MISQALAPNNATDEPLSSDASPQWPCFAEDEIEAAAWVLRSGKVNYWTGTEGRLFEREFAQSTGCKYAVAVANGTVALELALRGLQVSRGDEVIIPSRTYVATASAVVAVGARPVFADVDSNSQCVTPETIQPLISGRTRAIIAVHLGGWPCDMDPLNEFAHSRGIPVVEDCAQAQGATRNGQPVGSFGQVAAFSFCQDKLMTTAGEGGMVTTNDEAAWQRMWSYKDHGKSFDAVYAEERSGLFRWVHHSPGTNWRMTEVQSAIGRIQLRKLPGWLHTRSIHAARLRHRLHPLQALRIPEFPESIDPAWYRFYAFLRPAMLRPGWSRDRILSAIRAQGVPCSVGSCSEVYLERAFPTKWQPPVRLPIARHLGETSLAFLLHPTLGPRDIQNTCEGVERVFSEATSQET